MNQALLDSYERESARLRDHGDWLAKASPQRAGALAQLLDAQDPFVTQLLQGFAYTLARLDLKLESERQQVPAAVLQFLHPVVTLPVPARTIVQFGWAEGQVPAEGREIERGKTLQVRLADAGFSSEGLGEFRTCQSCVVPPVQLANAQLMAPTGSDAGRRRLALDIEVAGRGQAKLGELQMRLPQSSTTAAQRRRQHGSGVQYGLRLFLGGVERELSLALYHALTRVPVDGELRAGTERVRLNDCVRAVGFETDESLLPNDPRQSEPLRLLAEYAVMREKFLFVDLVGLAPEHFAGAGAKATLELLLDPVSAAMIEGASLPTIIKLGCVPIVNLEHVALPGRPLRRTAHEMEVAADSFEPEHREIYAIQEVRATWRGDIEVEYLPMFAPIPPGLARRRDQAGYWFTRRQPRRGTADGTVGQDVMLSLHEFDRARVLDAGRTLNATALCFRRNTVGLTEGDLLFSSDAGDARAVSRLQSPVWPNLSEDAVVHLVEFLSCGAAPFNGTSDAKPAIVRLLNLFRTLFHAQGAAAGLLDGEFISAVETAAAAAGVRGGIARGVEVHLTTRPVRTSVHEVYLLVRVLDYVLGAFAPPERFTKLSAGVKDGNSSKPLVACPPRVGSVALT